MSFFFKLLILFIFTSIALIQCEADECSKLYILPMFSAEDRCLAKANINV